MKRFLLCIGVLLFFSGQLLAYQFEPPWTNLDRYTMNFSVYDPSLPIIQGIDSQNTAGWGYVAIEDTDNNGRVSPGDKFTDYIVYYYDGFESKAGDSISAPGLNDTWQVSFMAELEGHVSLVTSSQENFSFDRLVKAELYVDNSTMGGFQHDLSDYLDGGVLLTGNSIVNGASAGNGGYLGFGASGQGHYQVAVSVEENSNYSGFLLDENGNSIFSQWETVAFYSDGDLTRVDLNDTTYSDIVQAFRDVFNISSQQSSILYTLSQQKGSIDVGAVPEPATLLLMGSGLLGIAGITRRKKKKLLG